jgi:hypothetical protein
MPPLCRGGSAPFFSYQPDVVAYGNINGLSMEIEPNIPNQAMRLRITSEPHVLGEPASGMSSRFEMDTTNQKFGDYGCLRSRRS